jgi:glycopeptide antibiotics resistance protein
LALDFDAWQAYVEDPKTYGQYSMSTSTVMFDLGYFVFLLVIVAAALLIFNLFWKLKCQKEEQKLLDGTFAVAGEVA